MVNQSFITALFGRVAKKTVRHGVHSHNLILRLLLDLNTVRVQLSPM